MIPELLLIIAALFVLNYIYHIIFFRRGLQNRIYGFNYGKPFVSVVVAARNEEKNLHYLLTALLNQNYPVQLYEVIIADDDSADGTSEIVNGFRDRFENLKLIRIKNRDQVRSPKKNALSKAIDISKGELILTTDADCLPGKNWISSHVMQFEDEVMMSVGWSETLIPWKKADICRRFEHFDFILMFLSAAGAISGGKYYSCSGQNLAYRKKAFEAVGGFDRISHLISGDDVNLMQLFRKAGYNIVFNFQPESFTRTRSTDDCISLLNQRSRWASNMKWQFGLNPMFFIYLISVLVMLVFPVVIAFYSILAAVIILALRCLLELFFLSYGFRVFGIEKKKLNFYPVWVILQPVYILSVSIMGLLDLFNWKNR